MTNYGKLITVKLQEEKKRAVHSEKRQKFNHLQFEENDLQFQLRYKDIEKYGVVLDYISISKSEQIIDLDIIKKQIETQADAIQKRITFLLEDFRLIEMDNQNKRAQLRSYPPFKDDDSKYYSEIILDEGHKVHFQRYAYNMKEKRYEKITSQLTIETFERLINELVSILK